MEKPQPKKMKPVVVGRIEPSLDAPENAKTNTKVNVLDVLSLYLGVEHHQHQLQQNDSALQSDYAPSALEKKKRSRKQSNDEKEI